ncbi:MAG TPA: histidinol-phosphate transaminase [Pyrinomonadaceae bacterium]|nr:histidinol-phosphate transaminase [Pyrinomonadaceae bacterium]
MEREETLLSRRAFAGLLGAGAAYSTLNPTIFGANPLSFAPDQSRTTVVRLSANENPYGPSQAAMKAMKEAFHLAWRYPDEYADMLVETIARLHNVAREQVLLGDGSGEILKLCASAFTSSSRKVVLAEPTFEAIMRYAAASGGGATKVSLTQDYRHDLARMLDAAGDAGLIYVCNPNNPTGTITPKEEVRACLGKIPQAVAVLVDEAYYHYAETADYESVIPLVSEHPNLIVARTFSKIYGMAGLRCGYAVAQSSLIKSLREHQIWDNVNIMAVAAANASVSDSKHVEDGRRVNSETKRFLYAELERLGFKYIPSQTNFMMIDLRRDVRPVIAAMKQKNVEVGRFFPALPNFMRVTVGKRNEMQAFLSAFREVNESNVSA